MAQRGCDFPIDVFALPCFLSYQNHRDAGITQVFVPYGLANGIGWQARVYFAILYGVRKNCLFNITKEMLKPDFVLLVEPVVKA